MTLSTAPQTTTTPAAITPWHRLRAWMFAARLDRELDRGVSVAPGTALAAHAWRITTFDQRVHLARSLSSTLNDARNTNATLTFRVPVQRDAVLANAELIDALTLRLHAALPVRTRGMARLRLLLADGQGPLYRPGRGSLAAQLRGILATL